VVKTLGLWSLPDILVIHFKRFRQQQSKGSQASKLTTMVKFPLTGFDMSTWHLASGNNNNIPNADSSSSANSTLNRKLKNTKFGLTKSMLHEDHRYDLYAVCYHQGDTLETGHYTASCKNPYDQQWYKFDDQRVSLISGDDIESKIINNEAYMLFYQRRKASESSESSGASTSSTEHWISKIVPPNFSTKTKAQDCVTEEESPPETVENLKDIEDEEGGEEKKKEENKALPEPQQKADTLVEALNVDDIEAIDGDDDDDIPEVVTKEDIEIKVDSNDAVLESPDQNEQINENQNRINVVVEIVASPPLSTATPPPASPTAAAVVEPEEIIEPIVEPVKEANESDKIEEMLSQQAINNLLWHDTNNNSNNVNRHSDVSNLKISDLLTMDNIDDEISSSSLPKNYMLKECEPIKRLRGVGSCSKEQLMYIDQQNILRDEESRAHWVSCLLVCC